MSRFGIGGFGVPAAMGAVLAKGPVSTGLPNIGVSRAASGGLRKMNAGYSGPCLRVRRASDNAEQDISYVNDLLDVASAMTFQGASTLFVTTLYDNDGTKHLTQPTQANQPKLFLLGPDPEILITGTQCLLIPSSVVIDRQDHAIMLVSRQYATGRLTRYVRFGATPDLDYYAYNSAFTLQAVGATAVNPTPNYAVIPPVNKSVVGMVSRATGLTEYRDELVATGAALGALTLNSGGQIGGVASTTNMDFYGYVIYVSAPTPTDVLTVNTALRLMYSTRTAITASIYALGDSITEGTGSTPGYPWPRLTGDMLTSGVVIHNGGIAGATIAANASPTFIIPGNHRKILFLWLGTNNLGSQGDNDTTVISRLETAADNARANGYDQVIVGTILPRSDGGWDATKETYRLNVNAALRVSSHFDGVCDFASDAVMGVNGSSLTDPARSSNILSLYPDKLHPSAQGYEILKVDAKNAIDAAIAKPVIKGTPQANATVGTPYSFTPVVTGGTTPFTFSIASGSLPAGLSLNTATGEITGTPTTVGASSGIVLRVTDAAAKIAQLPAFSITVGAAFSYMLDEVSAPAGGAYSLRKLKSSYNGPCLKIRRGSDSTTLDISFVNNVVDEAAITGFIGSSQGFVDTWYDQSGGGNHWTQATAGSQPTVSNASGVLLKKNGKLGLTFGAKNMGSPLSASPSNRSFSTVSSHDNNSGGSIFGSSANGGIELGWDGTQHLYLRKQGSAAFATSTAVGTVLNLQTNMATFDGNNWSLGIDGGAELTGTSAQTFTTGLTTRMGTGSSNLTGFITEIVSFDTILSSGDKSIIQTSQKNFYGTP